MQETYERDRIVDRCEILGSLQGKKGEINYQAMLYHWSVTTLHIH